MVFSMLSTTSSFYITEDSLSTACNVAESIITYSYEESLDPFIVSALIYHESRYKADAKSKAGACGLTQVIPKYVEPTCTQLQYNTDLSVETGVSVLKTWFVKSKGSYYRALQCYNSGYYCNSKPYAKKILRTAKKIKLTYIKTQRKMEDALH
jgi:soluble lytic murein transglycosylase-like protein